MLQGYMTREGAALVSGGGLFSPLPGSSASLGRKARGAPKMRRPFALMIAFQIDELIDRFSVSREQALRYSAKRFDRVWYGLRRGFSPTDLRRLWGVSLVGRNGRLEPDRLERIDILVQRLSRIYDRARRELAQLESACVSKLRQKTVAG